ncbi:MAG: flagellar hook-basal body protein [Clostridia bacterium]|nr:flagellar hook-basal body protein [Clostridia bacterium]
MLGIISAGLNGLRSYMTKMDQVANNIANVSTVGFKKGVAELTDLAYQPLTYQDPYGPGATQSPIGSGARVGAVKKDLSPGPPVQTGRALDLYIDGDGFFEVLLPSGQRAYTRDGSFSIDSQGHLVNAQGLRISSSVELRGANLEEVRVSPEGIVTASDAAGNEQVLGEIFLFLADNPLGMLSIGNNLYQLTLASGAARQATPGVNNAGVFRQRFLEGSNVNLVQEIPEIITALRAHQLNTKTIQLADEMWALANNLRR